MTKRYVLEGEVFTVTLPYSEVCMWLGIAGEPYPVRITYSGMAQILKPYDFTPYTSPVTTGEAGIYQDANGYYISEG